VSADRRPVLLLTFANNRQDAARYLRNVPEEARRIESALSQASLYRTLFELKVSADAETFLLPQCDCVWL
jgi:hypothetical protein